MTALQGVTIGGTQNAGTAPVVSSTSGTALKGVSIGATAPAAPAAPVSTTALTSVKPLLDPGQSAFPPLPKPTFADTSSAFSKFTGLNKNLTLPPAPIKTGGVSTVGLEKGQKSDADNSVSGIVGNTLGGLPEAATKVSKAINDVVINKPGDLLSNSDFIKQASEGTDAGSVAGGTAQGMLQKLSLGLQGVEGVTGGAYQAPDLDPEKNNFLDKGLSILSQAVGFGAGITALGSVATTKYLAGSRAAVTGLTDLAGRLPLVGKYIAPFIEPLLSTATGAAVESQLDPKLAADYKQRAKTLGVAIATAPLYTALGAIKNAPVGLGTSFTLGYGMAKLSGATNADALTSGLAFTLLDGFGRAGENRGFTAEEITQKLNDEALKILQPYSKTKLTSSSSAEDIKNAYYRAAHQTHPDVGGTQEAFTKVQSAYDLLSKGAVSNAGTKGTEAEQSVKALKGDVQSVTAEHGPEVAKQALTERLGLDEATSRRLVVHANKPDEVPKPVDTRTDEAITADSIKHVEANIDSLVSKYIDTHGNVVGADEAKELVPGYSNDRSTSDLVQKAAGKIAEATYDHLLETKQGTGNNTVLITAGGTGAGKSTSIKELNTKDFPVVFDTNLSNAKGGIDRIQKALDAGFDVDMRFTYTRPDKAYDRVLDRAEQMANSKGTGRPVSVQGHLDMHYGSHDALPEIIKHFEAEIKDGRLGIKLYDNSGMKAVEHDNPLDFINNVRDNRDYETDYHSQLNEQRRLAFQEGRISEKTNRGFDRAETLRPRKEGQRIPEVVQQGDKETPANILKHENKSENTIEEQSFTEGSPVQKTLSNEEKTNFQSGFVSPTAIAQDIAKALEGADAQIKDFVEKTMIPIALSENLTDSFVKLEGAAQADLEMINKIVLNLPINGKDDEALYYAAEDPSEKLTPKQKELKDSFDKPLQKINQFIYERIKNNGTPLPDDETYIARFPKERPSAMQRVLNPAAGRTASASQGSILSKSSPSFKKRTMKILTDESGKRTVVAIKDGRVTAFTNKEKTDLGTLKVKKNSDLRNKELEPLQKKIAALQKESEILKSVKVGSTGAEAKLASVEDKAFAIAADFMDTSMAADKGLDAKNQKKLKALTHDMRILAKIKKGEDIVLRKQRLETLEKKIIEASNLMADVENQYNENDLNKKVFIDNDGKRYVIGDATTKEIEKHTDLEYYHSALASRLLQYVKLRQIDRANQFLESWKESEDFKKVAIKSDEIAPAGWKTTKQVNFRNYSFEPRVAEVLDDLQKQMDGGNYNNAFTGINRVLADAIFFNGLAHPINVLLTHTYNRGVSGVLYPPSVIRGIKAGNRALKAMNEKNEDYMQLLRNGAHLMSSNVNNQKVAENLAQKLNDDLGNKPDLRDRLLRALGYTLGQASFKTNVIYKLSHDMAWLSNDFLTMQSIFETMDERGLSMEDAVKETARFIPDYRRKARLLDKPLSAAGKLVGKQEAGGNTGRFIAEKIVYNSGISMFGSYHVGLMESLKNTIVDTAKGTDWTFSAESNVQRLKAADKFAMLGFLMLVVYPWLDKKAQEAFGETSYITRSGIAKYPYLAYKVATGQTSSSQAAQQIITPSVLVWEALQQFTDHDFFTGSQITGPSNEGRVAHALSAVAPYSEFSRVATGKATLAEFGATLLGVHTPKNTQLAYNLNTMLYDEKPKVLTEAKAHIAAGDEAGALALVQEFNSRLVDSIRANDIAGNGTTTDERVNYFFNQYGLKMPGATAMANYKAKQGQNIVQKTLPNGTPVIVKNTPVPATGVIGVITTYAKALGTDPVEAFQLIFSGQTIKNVENGAIIVNRMSLADSQAVKKAGGGNNPDFKLDHIVPLEGGGDNSDSNLQLIPTAQWQSNTNVENFIGDQLKAGTMTKAQARETAIRFKAGQGEILSPALMKEYTDKYGGKPLTEQDVYNFSNTLDK